MVDCSHFNIDRIIHNSIKELYLFNGNVIEDGRFIYFMELFETLNIKNEILSEYWQILLLVKMIFAILELKKLVICIL